MAEISKSPQATPFQQQVTHYGSRGLVLKKDPAMLEEGQYSELTNMISIQEGQLTQRTGHRRITGNSSFDTGQPNLIYSITSLHTSSTQDYYYAGAVNNFGSIFRSAGPIPQTGAGMAFEQVAVSTSALTGTSAYETMRWTAVKYAAGSIGTPYIFFACPLKMLKDNGTLESGDGSGDGTTKIQRWGIIPPTYPATAALDAITILPATEVVTGTGRVNTTISSFTGTGPGLVAITPASMAGIIDGMLLNIHSGVLAIVEEATATQFFVYLAATPANGWTITSGQTTSVPGAIPGTVDQFTINVPGAEFNGIVSNGYDTDDVIHIAIGIADPVNITDIRFRVMVANATGVDYYEKEILPSQIQPQASVDQTATATLPPVTQNVDSGVLGPYNIADDTASRAKPVTLNQVPPNQSTSVPVWTEIDIPKTQFLKIGQAGVAGFTWANVKGFQVVSVGTASDIWIGSIYVAGGFGPNALSNIANVPLLPYDYLYCVTQDTPVLCDDLSWRPAGELREGQGIIAFEEIKQSDLKRHHKCKAKYKRATIVHNSPERKECFEIKTDIGIPVKATGDHPWLTFTNRRIRNDEVRPKFTWKRTSELQLGDNILHFMQPWEEDLSKDAGWLAGILDGEGSIGVDRKKMNGSTHEPWNLGVAQKSGLTLDRIKAELSNRIGDFYEYVGKSGCTHISITGFGDKLKLLGTVRPERLIENLKDVDFLPGLKRNVTYNLAVVTSITPIGESDIASIQTSCGTFITAGYLSHNTFRNTQTGLESNPSPAMIANNYVTPLRQAVRVSMISSTDNQVSGMPTTPAATTQKGAIAVYRRGGAFADGLYRLVGYATNSVGISGGANVVTFVDQQSDASLISAPLISFDNDPPVRSTLPIPFVANFSAYSGGFTGAPGYNRFSVTVVSAPDPTDFRTFLNVGSVITIAPNTESQEVCAVVARTATTIDTIFQYDHTTPGSGVFITCDSVVGQPCNLALTAFDSAFLAGDENNPHVLYKSKTGAPEVFPVVELDTGIADQINVGTPANPIMNMIEYNGQILCMNLDSLFVIQVFLGQMQAPIKTAATRGLYAQQAWCKVENEIWYLAYDGIYSWAGGECVKRSEAIDPLFHGISIGPYAAIDLSAQASALDPVFTNAPESPKDFITMFYSKQRVYIVYRDINYGFHRLRYDILYDRWTVENLGSELSGSVIPTAAYVIEEYGFRYDHATGAVSDSNILLATCILNSSHSPTAAAYLDMDDVGTSDGWVNDPSDGAPISYSFQPAAYTLGAPSFQKQYSDCITELNNDAGLVQIQTYYNFSPVPDSSDFFTIPMPTPSQGRKRSIFSFQNGYGKEAYSLQFRYSGTTTGNVTFYTNTFNYFSLDQLQIGRAFDWDDLGTPDDKRLYEVSIWYDAKDRPHTWVLDCITGVINSQVVHEDVQEFILEPLGGTFTGPSWTQVTFPINDTILTSEGIQNSIVKKVRLRPKNPGGGGSGATCVLDTTLHGGVSGQYGMQDWGIFKSGVNYYRALFDGVSTNRLYILKSTDGTSWTNVTGSKTINGGGAPATGVAVSFDGTFIYVLYAASGSANPRAMTVSKFNTGTDAWATDITGLPTMDTTATTSGFGPGNMAIAAKPNGKLEIIYNGNHQTISAVIYSRVYWSEYTGSWSAGVAITGQTGIAKDFLSSQILVNSSNRTHIVLQTYYSAASGFDIYHVSIPDAGSQQTFQLLTSDASTRVYDLPTAVGLGLAYKDAMNVDRIVIPYIPGGNGTDGAPDFGPAPGAKVLRAVDADNPTWTPEIVETSTQVSGFQPAFEVLISAAYDISSDSLFVLWVTPTSYGTPGGSEVVSTSGLVVYSANSGTGWSAPVTVDSFTTPTVPSGVIGMFFSAGILTTLIYTVDSTGFYV